MCRLILVELTLRHLYRALISLPQVTIVNSAATLLPHDGFAPRFKAAMIDEVATAGVELLLNTRVVRYCVMSFGAIGIGCFIVASLDDLNQFL